MSFTLGVELHHNHVIGVAVHRVVSLVEHEKADVPAKVNETMTQRIQEHMRCGDDHSIRGKYCLPQALVFPLIGLKCARYHTDSDRQSRTDNILLLIAEADCRGDKLGNLKENRVKRWHQGHER